MAEEQRTITDPARIRALAHPLRLDLLAHLDEVGEATATECARTTGETVANCSFHLRSLAKAGFIEPAEPRGRERPWRPVDRGGRRLDFEPGDPASARAVEELASLSVAREADRVRAFLSSTHDLPEQWEGTVTVTTSSFWATAEEMRELVDTVAALTDRFAGRHHDPALRPPGATRGRLFATVNPDEIPSED
ncbi:helix-turn-helix domain-containing protein [Cellulomonas bogoriensis]|uniref:helix-turn-helix domain-containing protein n=1 Tax=Cellulomonas bogoriensis TaxID=301388 RepID=UPI00068B201D|nr:helix-turn-helix domain-containing protein [Cellulomonas bogoriensis]